MKIWPNLLGQKYTWSNSKNWSNVPSPNSPQLGAFDSHSQAESLTTPLNRIGSTTFVDHSKTSTLAWFSHSFTTFYVCLGWLSCGNTQLHSRPKSILLHYSIYFLYSTRSTGSKTAPQHNTNTLLENRYGVPRVKRLTFLIPNIFLFNVAKQLTFYLIWHKHINILQKVFSSSRWSAANLSWSKGFLLAQQPLSPCWCEPHFIVVTFSSFQFIADWILGGFWLTLDHPHQFSLGSRWLFAFFSDCGSDVTVPCSLYLKTTVCTFALGTCYCFEMTPNDFPDLFKSIICSFRSMLSSLDFPTVVFVTSLMGVWNK